MSFAFAPGWTHELKPDDVCAFLFPGTGSAAAPDLLALSAAGPSAPRIIGDVVDAVDEGLPRSGWPSMRSILVNDPASYRAAARSPGVAQLAAYATSVSVERVLRAEGLAPGFAIGQSFGEIAAMVCAGVFSVSDGARMAVSLVGVLSRRGEGGGMGLMEADEDAVRDCIEQTGESQVVVACLNAPGVTVVSGPDGPLEAVLAAAVQGGIRAVRLAVPYLSHHPAMAGADDEWYAMIRAFDQRPLELPVYSPVRGRAYRDDDDLHRALTDCIVKPVRLPEILRAVHAAGTTAFTEAGAGNALCQCARLTIPGVPTLAPLRERRRAPASGADEPSGPSVSKSAPGISGVPAQGKPMD
ncbi:acyltransferase domain-containing protein [Actinomadura barringtoniae]|uniref:Acyltransferase domain-containing protein n=1 Tax=Actinomadura barringtoniae TaxID=1427535 RepID=A0A939PLA0_9ACTN|nr:acyltransferase domain-containing protein [Actinomadura barringtoniae]MBO2454695.1 acyltransferase domain-containing protein [Actinomadura barringtoniae]